MLLFQHSVALDPRTHHYLSQDKVKAHNPELISSIKEDLSSNIKDMKEVQHQEELEMRSVVAKSSREDSITISTEGAPEGFDPKKTVLPIDIEETSWGVASWQAKQAAKPMAALLKKEPVGAQTRAAGRAALERSSRFQGQS